ncbi:CCA tRNA nucleotidyltransferase [Alloacidobacterium sp.]|uniref:CCA tRNA nucleotidyltransferase n=1 Tax=Alloacidobacterium sp. TaxID=2951999 RepID=UPI002D23D0EE|nr:CCA tRNA nucleotidyltransferase [Alloacidobacterium sp.]HYK36363.1 CCA tRNA nucleotidyltransferase [Alloacidobacterium sp.]
MPDYIYLLENRLSPAQQKAVQQVRDAARDAGMTVFLTGGAVRDLSTGTSVRDLDFTVQGNATKLKKPLEKAGATLWGEYEPTRTLFFWFPGSVRVEVSSARREEYPKPGKPVYHWAPILDDLRRRDFTANAMAISLNEGSYGLLLDPLNGMADIEARHLRLVSPYGFIEDPSRVLRAVRLRTRLGWDLDDRTQARYENAKNEGVIDAIPTHLKGYELEEIGHEEDGLRALKTLESEGWMKHIFPAWTSAKADVRNLENLRENYYQLLIQGVHPDISAPQMELLTAKMQPKDIATLKRAFIRPGFVQQWNHLETETRHFAKVFTGKEAATPSATWKLLTSYQPEPVLWLAHTGKGAAIQNKFKNFFTVWPEARQKVPAALMQEMRITPDIERYDELLRELFFNLIDNKLRTDEEMKAFLEPYSPPAPPPPVTIRRSRKKAAEPKIKSEKPTDEEVDEEELPHPDDLDLEADDLEETEDEEEAEEEETKPAAKSKASPAPAKKEAEKKPASPAPARSAKKETARPAVNAKTVPAKKEPAKPAPAKSAKKAAPPAKKQVVKKSAPKPAPKKPAKTAAKPVAKKPAKKVVAKPARPAKKAAKKKR